MNNLDLFLCLPIAYGLYKGFKKGLVFEIISIVSLVIALFLSKRFSNIAEQYLMNQEIISEKYLGVVSFILLFITIVLVINLIGKIIEKVLKTVHLQFINKIAGAVFGGIKFFLIISVMVFFFDRFNGYMEVINPKSIQQSKLYQSSIGVSEFLTPKILNHLSVNKPSLEQ